MNSREIALQVLAETEKGAYSNLVLNNYLEKINDKRDKALTTEIVYGVLRNKNRLDYLISFFSSRSLTKIDNLVLLALRIGLYQLVILDKIPERAAINETVKALKGKVNKGAVGFVNGLLRNYTRKWREVTYPDPQKDPVNFLEVYYSHPRWLIELWIQEYGYDKTEQLCRYNNLQGELTIRINSLKYTVSDIIKLYQENNIEIYPTNVPGNYRLRKINNVKKLPLFNEGGLIVQGPAATLASLLLAPTPGSRVLDMAAAPGGKTTHLAELMKNWGEIVALDIYDHKIKLINENCKRLNIEIVKTLKADGTGYKDKRGFDMVLVDAPCSGTGLIRQKPEIKWNKNKDDLADLVSIQGRMLQNAAKLVKDKGYILYSTCTLTPQENRGVINSFMEEHKHQFKVINIEPILKKLGINNLLSNIDNGMMELFPPDSMTEGFFITKLQKV